jgi:hypothetical protein
MRVNSAKSPLFLAGFFKYGGGIGIYAGQDHERILSKIDQFDDHLSL